MIRKSWALRRVLKGLAACTIVLLLIQPTFDASAHPADMYVQNQAIQITSDGLLIDWNILPGPFLADAVWAAADQDQNGAISSEEAKAWVEPYIAGLLIMLDGRPLDGIQTQSVHWPATVDVLRTGEDAVSVSLVLGWPEKLSGSHALEIHNTHLESNSLNSFLLTSEGGLSFDQPAQNNGQLRLNVQFPNAAAAGNIPPTAVVALMTSWNSGTPNLPSGFSDTVSRLAVDLANPASGPTTPGGTAGITSALTGLVKTQQFSPLFLLGAFLLSLALGCLHALTPGHGKALVGAYLVGSQGRTRDAILLGGIVTITHTGSVLGLGLFTLVASHYILPALILPWLEVISGVLVIGFGINLLIQRRRDLAVQGLDNSHHDHQHGEHDHAGHSHSHPHPHPKRFNAKPQSRGDRLNIFAPSRLRVKAQGGESAPERAETIQQNQVSFKSLLTLGISGGLVPCPDAIAILLVAVAINRIPFGMLLIVSFSVGLALILIAIGLAMVHGVRIIARSNWLSRFSVYAPLVSAVVVSGLGVGLTLNALNSFKFAATVVGAGLPAPFDSENASQRPAPAMTTFDLSQARLLYIASDQTGWDQIFMQPPSGGKPVQYTHESSGVTGYSISPDQKTILYSVFKSDIGSSIIGTTIWAINADGSQPRVVLDCPQAECNSPEWYPDGQKIAYERLDDLQNSSVPRFSIWWLDLKTGKTQPVFQDRNFASFAPRFSPDGQWLSYISTATNTMTVYNLKDGRNLSVPLGSQSAIPETWSPAGDALLFGNQLAMGEPPPMHIKIYVLDSGKTIDLGGPKNSTDYFAAWSPDGKWIAIDRNVPGADTSGSSNQVWLVKPDGSDAHVLRNEAGASYSDLEWSPDGRYLLYSLYAQNSKQNVPHFDVYVTDIQTGKSSLLVPGGDLATFLR